MDWTKELNLISWNGKEVKYDLRDWAPKHEKMGKGVTLSVDELKKQKNYLIIWIFNISKENSKAQHN